MTQAAKLLTLAGAALFAGAGHANFLDPGFSGNTDFDAWDNLTITNPQIAAADPAFPSFSGSTSPWPEGIESALTGIQTVINDNGTPGDPLDDFEEDIVVVTDETGDAVFDRVAGTSGYPAGASIYNSFGTGTYTVSDTNVLPGLETVLFQIELGAGVENFFGPEGTQVPGFFSPTTGGGEPVLNFNGGSQELAPVYEDSFAGPRAFSVPIPGIPGGTTIIFAFQWDLAGLGPISSYEIVWTTIEFGTSYAIQLDSSSTFSLVPTPGAVSLLAVAGLAAARRRRSN
ncbi:MAG: hypothetical protein AAGI30_07645 [Planctomycetota bacterium]